MCRENDLYEPSFPVDTMNLVELQRAVLGPVRWRNNVHWHAKMGADFTLPYERRSFASGSRKYRRVHLVTGGRYLISLAHESYWFITLWDLGVPTLSRRSECEPKALCTLTIESEAKVRDICGPVYCSSFLRFTASIAASEDTLAVVGTSVAPRFRVPFFLLNLFFRRCRVYEVGPLPENAEIREIRDIPVHYTTWDALCPMIDWKHVAAHGDNIDVWDLSHEEDAPFSLQVERSSEVAVPIL